MSEEKNMDPLVVVSFCVAALKCGWVQRTLSTTLLKNILTLLPLRGQSRILLFRSGELEDDIQWINEHADAALEFRHAWLLLACLVIGVADMPGGGWQCPLAKNTVHKLAVQCLDGQVAVPRPSQVAVPRHIMLARFLGLLNGFYSAGHFTKVNVDDERPRCGQCGHTYTWLTHDGKKPKVNLQRRQLVQRLGGVTQTRSAQEMQPRKCTSNNGPSRNVVITSQEDYKAHIKMIRSKRMARARSSRRRHEHPHVGTSIQNYMGNNKKDLCAKVAHIADNPFKGVRWSDLQDLPMDDYAASFDTEWRTHVLEHQNRDVNVIQHNFHANVGFDDVCKMSENDATSWTRSDTNKRGANKIGTYQHRANTKVNKIDKFRVTLASVDEESECRFHFYL